MGTRDSIHTFELLIRNTAAKVYLPERNLLIERKIHELADKILLSQKADEQRNSNDKPHNH
jgi:hypothetical protein